MRRPLGTHLACPPVEDLISSTLDAVQRNITELQRNAETHRTIARGADGLIAALRADGRIFAAGNGGSLCDAMHFAEELSGSFRDPRPALAATAIADPAHLTCVGNDFGFEHVFERYVEAHVRTGDALVAISTSGRSPNVVLAAEAARSRGAFVLALTGRRDSRLAECADVEICTPVSGYSDRVQEQHIIVVHLLVELIERALFPQNYAA